MSSNKESKVPMKGTIIINPKTQRPVKVGSRTWLKLVKEGVVEGKYSDPKELYEIQDGDDVDELINKFNQSLPPNVQSVRGRGRYKNKIVRRMKQPSTKEITEYTARTAARTVSNNIENLKEFDDLETQLENMIMNEILGKSNLVRQKSNLVRQKSIPKREQPEIYEIHSEYDSDEDSYEYSDY